MEKRISIVSLKMETDKELRSEYEEHILNPLTAKKVARKIIGNKDKECFLLLTLNSKNQINNASIISEGTLNSSLVHPREVFKVAVLSNANKIMVFHNHPSGDVNPSKEDLNITKRLRDCGELMGIGLMDHIIVCEDEEIYYSFKEAHEI